MPQSGPAPQETSLKPKLASFFWCKTWKLLQVGHVDLGGGGGGGGGAAQSCATAVKSGFDDGLWNSVNMASLLS